MFEKEDQVPFRFFFFGLVGFSFLEWFYSVFEVSGWFREIFMVFIKCFLGKNGLKNEFLTQKTLTLMIFQPP